MGFEHIFFTLTIQIWTLSHPCSSQWFSCFTMVILAFGAETGSVLHILWRKKKVQQWFSCFTVVTLAFGSDTGSLLHILWKKKLFRLFPTTGNIVSFPRWCEFWFGLHKYSKSSVTMWFDVVSTRDQWWWCGFDNRLFNLWSLVCLLIHLPCDNAWFNACPFLLALLANLI